MKNGLCTSPVDQSMQIIDLIEYLFHVSADALHMVLKCITQDKKGIQREREWERESKYCQFLTEVRKTERKTDEEQRRREC